MSRWLPYERLTLTTLLSPEDVRARLAREVEPERPYRFLTTPHTPLEGRVDGDTFVVTPILWYRSSLKPVIEGVLDPDGDGCTITLVIAPHLLMILIMVFGFGGAALTMIKAGLAAGGWFGMADAPELLFWREASLVFVIGYPLIMGLFTVELRKLRAYFCSIWEVYEVSTQ